jgi:hypothetical protein
MLVRLNSGLLSEELSDFPFLTREYLIEITREYILKIYHVCLLDKDLDLYHQLKDLSDKEVH